MKEDSCSLFLLVTDYTPIVGFTELIDNFFSYTKTKYAIEKNQNAFQSDDKPRIPMKIVIASSFLIFIGVWAGK